jgi:hypothetical protein
VPELSNVIAVSRFFELTTAEMKAEYSPLSKEDKQELGDLCRKALAEQAEEEKQAA